MASGPFILRRPSPFVFPGWGGAPPGFDLNHPASGNLANKYGLACVALPRNFYNYTAREILKNASTNFPVYSVRDKLGPCNLISVGTDTLTTINIDNKIATPPGYTYAGIVEFTGTGDGSFCSIIAANGGNAGQFGMNGTAKNVFWYNSGASVSSFVLSLNTPYFIAGSGKASSTVNLVATNLNTGQIFSTATTTAGALGTSVGNPYVGCDASGARNHPATAYIAAVMWSPTFLSMPQMLMWAADPWSFWYPNVRPQFRFATPTAVAPAAIVGELVQVNQAVKRAAYW